MVTRGKKAVGKRPIVCDEEQTFRIDIKTSHREEIFPLLFIDQVHDRLPAAVLRRRDHALRFIQKIIFQFHVLHRRIVEQDRIFALPDLCLRFFHDLAVHLDPSFPDHLLELRSRTFSHISQIFVQPDCFFQIFLSFRSRALRHFHSRTRRLSRFRTLSRKCILNRKAHYIYHIKIPGKVQ